MIRWAIAIGLGLFVAWLAYSRSLTAGQRVRVLVLAAVRFAAVLLVAALFLGAPAAPPSPASPLLAIDASASWRRAGGDDSATVKALRTKWQSAVREAGPEGVLVLVGDSLRETGASDVARLMPNDASSRMRPAVDRAAALGRPLWLLSDGEGEDADALADAPPGSRLIVPPRNERRDVALADLAVPPSASAGDTLQVSALLASGAAGGTEGLDRSRRVCGLGRR